MSGKIYLLVDFLPTSPFPFLSLIYLVSTSEEKLILTLLTSTKLDQYLTEKWFKSLTQPYHYIISFINGLLKHLSNFTFAVLSGKKYQKTPQPNILWTTSYNENKCTDTKSNHATFAIKRCITRFFTTYFRGANLFKNKCHLFLC